MAVAQDARPHFNPRIDGSFVAGKTSWSQVSSEEIACTKAHQDVATVTEQDGPVGMASMSTFLATHGPRCCGSLAKTREGGLCSTSATAATTTVAAAHAVAPRARLDSQHYVTLTVTMPLTEAEFDQATQDKYKAAMAAAAGTDPANVEILRVTLEYIYVKTRAQPHAHAHAHTHKHAQIRAVDAAGASKLMDTLGSDDQLLTKINAELEVRASGMYRCILVRASGMYACIYIRQPALDPDQRGA